MASAPLTFGWLLILFVTTRIQRSAGRRGSKRIQRKHSTNLRRLSSEPSRVLAASLFWLDGRMWWPYVPMFAGVVAPAERRLRWWRWLLVGSAAHAIGTFAGQGFLRWSLKKGEAPRRLVNARDVGVSYFVLGVAGTLSGYVRAALEITEPGRGRRRIGRQRGASADLHRGGPPDGVLVGLAAVPLAPDRDRSPYPGVAPGRRMTP